VFEWDPAKAAANLAKHEVSFKEAETTFDDPAAVDAPDMMHSATEQRMRHLGRSSAGAVLMVVYTVRRKGADGQEAVRIISARRANRAERATYRALAEED
jgi:uncharacterized DUF497 family protein